MISFHEALEFIPIIKKEKNMRVLSVSLCIAAALAAPADIPTVSICTTSAPKTCYKMPVVGQGSCCGAYNISSYLQACSSSPSSCHIDTSVDYGSQPTIAAAVKASGLPRSSLWITSKLNVESSALDMSADLDSLVLAPLQMDYVDLLLIHHAGRWKTDNNPHPPCFNLSAAGPAGPGTYYQCRMDVVQAMEALVASGKVRTWGVSNWQVRDLEQMYAKYGYYPALNQIEHHPWWHESEVVAFCNKHVSCPLSGGGP
jgi:hypothetical protein